MSETAEREGLERHANLVFPLSFRIEMSSEAPESLLPRVVLVSPFKGQENETLYLNQKGKGCSAFGNFHSKHIRDHSSGANVV